MPEDEELIRLSATQAVELLRAGKISPLDLVDAAAKRIQEADDRINALPLRFFDRAREVAKRFPIGKSARAEKAGWLAGLPIAVKDYNDVEGQVTTYGSPLYKDNVAGASDTTVLTLEAAGAIPIAKSNVPEFAGANTFNPVYGSTRNPWNLERSAGGSSGGSAAALAAGMVWLATGNDLGGSLRIPASFCGIVGLRPSVGRVPRPAANPSFDALWVEGPMGRTVSDVALMLDAESAQVVGDPWSKPPPATPFVSAVKSPAAPRRVAFTSNLGLSKVEPEVADICRAGVNSLRNAGVGVDDACPDLSGGIEAFQTLRALMFASVRGGLLQKHREEIAPHIVWNLEKGMNLTADEILRAERTRASIYAKMVTFFRSFDVLACPVVAVPPFPVAQTYPTEIAGEKLQTYIDWMFLTFVITLTGCPAISVPAGFTASGLPVGLQLIGRPHGDYDLLAAARVFEQTRGELSPALPVG